MGRRERTEIHPQPRSAIVVVALSWYQEGGEVATLRSTAMMLAAPEVSQTEPPTKEELRILREEIDPFRYIIGR